MNREILLFLKELTQHNDREWFREHKARFDALHKSFLQDVQLLIDRIALFDPDIRGLDAKDCLFRIYRDTRFSANKLPYKNHFAAYIASRGGRKSERAGYYIHLQPEGSLLAGGAWCPPPPLLKRLREDIYEHIDEFEGILQNETFKKVFPELAGERLKRMPAGFPSDFPQGEILKHKDFTVVSKKSDTFFESSDWIEKAVNDFSLLRPFNRFLNYTIDEFLGLV